MHFKDRKDAGRSLAGEFDPMLSGDTVVCGLPRGGVVVAAEVAEQLHAPLGIINIRKIVHPTNHEFAIGAIAEGCNPVLNEQDLDGLDKSQVLYQISQARQQLRLRREKYSSVGIEPPELHDKTVIIVDDGSATGLTMQAAVAYARKHNAKRVVVGLPVAPRDVLEFLQEITDAVVSVLTPRFFAGAVGAYYISFDHVDDTEVMQLLKGAEHVHQRVA